MLTTKSHLIPSKDSQRHMRREGIGDRDNVGYVWSRFYQPSILLTNICLLFWLADM